MDDGFKISKIDDIRLLNSGQIEFKVNFTNGQEQKHEWMNLEEIDEYEDGHDLVNEYQQSLNSQLKKFPFFHGVDPVPPSKEQQQQRQKKQKKLSREYQKIGVLQKTIHYQRIARPEEGQMQEKSESDDGENISQKSSPLPFGKLYQKSILGTSFKKNAFERRKSMKKQRLQLSSNVMRDSERDEPPRIEENPHYEYEAEKQGDKFLVGRYERVRINSLPSKLRGRRWKKIPLNNDLTVEPNTLTVLDINQRKGKKYCKVQADNQLYWMEKSIVQQKYLEQLLRFYEKRIYILPE